MVGVDDGAPSVRGKAWRWGFYAVSLGFAFSELITGLVAQQRDEWILPWVLCVEIPPSPKKRTALLTPSPQLVRIMGPSILHVHLELPSSLATAVCSVC